MKAQRDELFYSLPKQGWEVLEVKEFHFVPWVNDTVDEKWTIESIWRPVGFRSFVYFMVDPQTSPSQVRRKGEKVWAIRVSSGEEYNDFVLRKGHWQETLKEIFAELAKLRQRGLT